MEHIELLWIVEWLLVGNDPHTTTSPLTKTPRVSNLRPCTKLAVTSRVMMIPGATSWLPRYGAPIAQIFYNGLVDCDMFFLTYRIGLVCSSYYPLKQGVWKKIMNIFLHQIWISVECEFSKTNTYQQNSTYRMISEVDGNFWWSFQGNVMVPLQHLRRSSWFLRWKASALYRGNVWVVDA